MKKLLLILLFLSLKTFACNTAKFQISTIFTQNKALIPGDTARATVFVFIKKLWLETRLFSMGVIDVGCKKDSAIGYITGGLLTRRSCTTRLKPGNYPFWCKGIFLHDELDITVKAGETYVLEFNSNTFVSKKLRIISKEEMKKYIKKRYIRKQLKKNHIKIEDVI
jgi:hypothetical protein